MKGKMRAAILYAHNTVLKLEQVDIPQIGPGEALVKVKACGLCHTDLSLIGGNARNLPHSLGHEGAGEVVEIGEGVTNFKVGDRVCIFLRFVCGDCVYCRTGRDNQCANMAGRFGMNVDGAYADYAKAPARAIFKLPASISYEEGGIIADCVATVYRALVRRGELKPSDNVMVLGVGGLGLSAVLISKMVGARVIAVDILEGKLDFAKKLGADEVVNASREKVPEAVKHLTSGVGVDLVIDLLGTGNAILTGLDSLAPSGRLVQVGHSEESFTARVRQLSAREISIIGNSANTRQDLADTIDLVGSGRLHIKPIITDEFNLAQVNEAIDKLRKHEILGRAVIKP